MPERTCKLEDEAAPAQQKGKCIAVFAFPNFCAKLQKELLMGTFHVNGQFDLLEKI